MTLLDDAWSTAVCVIRLGRGEYVRHGGARRQPELLLELWEFEACPFCRKVREALSELDLDYVCHPTAKGSNNRRDTPDWNGRKYYPHLRDPNTHADLKESEDIIDYLHETYGAGRPQSARLFVRLNDAGSYLASAVRPLGRVARFPDREQPAEPPILYSFEGCPYSRKVRERLQELNLDFVVRNVAKKSPDRPALRERGGKIQVPYFIDPNTGVEMYESDDINAYLERTYG